MEISNIIDRTAQRAACIAVVGGDESGKTTYVKHLLNMLTIKHVVVVVPNQEVADEYRDVEKVEHIIEASCCIEQVSALKRDCRAVQMAINNTKRYVEFDTRVALVFDNMDCELEDNKAWFGEILASCQFANITVIATLKSPHVLSPFARTQIDYAVRTTGKFSWVIYNVLEAGRDSRPEVVTAYAPKQEEVFDAPVPVSRHDGTPEEPDPEAEKWAEMMANPTNVAVIGGRGAGKTSMAIRLIRHTPVHENRVIVWGDKIADHPHYRPYTHMLLEDYSVDELNQIFERLWETQRSHKGKLKSLLVIDRPWNFIRESAALANWIERFVVFGRNAGLSVIMCIDHVSMPVTIRANIDKALVATAGSEPHVWTIFDGLGEGALAEYKKTVFDSGSDSDSDSDSGLEDPYDVSAWKDVFEKQSAMSINIIGRRNTGKTTLAGKLVEQAKLAGYKRVVWIPTHEHSYVPDVVEPHQVRRDIGSKEIEGFIETLVREQQQLKYTEKMVLVIDSKIELYNRKAQVHLKQLLLYNRFINMTVILTVDSPKLLAREVKGVIDHFLIHPKQSAKYSWVHKIEWSDDLITL